MKKFLTILVVLTALGSAVTVNAIDKPKSHAGMAVVKSGSVFKLFYQGARSGNVKVTIYDSKGNEVFKEKLRHLENFMRPYNFSSLNEGEYTIEIDGEDGKQIQKIDYRTGKIERLMKLVRVSASENKYMLTVPNKGSEKLEIRIYNDSNALIYNGTEKIEGDFAKIYTLSHVGNQFAFEVTDHTGSTKSLAYSLK